MSKKEVNLIQAVRRMLEQTGREFGFIVVKSGIGKSKATNSYSFRIMGEDVYFKGEVAHSHCTAPAITLDRFIELVSELNGHITVKAVDVKRRPWESTDPRPVHISHYKNYYPEILERLPPIPDEFREEVMARGDNAVLLYGHPALMEHAIESSWRARHLLVATIWMTRVIVTLPTDVKV